MACVKVIKIDENPELIREANELLLRTENSNDANDELEIRRLIDRILKYIQDEEYPLMFPDDESLKSNITIQFFLYRPELDGTVEKLYSRKWEIARHCKDKHRVDEIHINPKEIEIFYRRAN